VDQSDLPGSKLDRPKKLFAADGYRLEFIPFSVPDKKAIVPLFLK